MTRWRRLTSRMTTRALAAAAAGVVIILAVAASSNWRLAFIAALAAGAIALTRLRYAPVAALVLLAITLGLALSGYSAGSDERADPAPAPHR